MSKLQTIRLVDAARFTERQPEPHQAAAWNWLQELLTAEQVSEFAGMFRAGPKLTPPPTAGWMAPALEVIREFESFSADAYPDPGSGGEPWTIGWGSTFNQQGAPFRKGDTVSRAEADALLARDVNIAATAVDRALPGIDLNANQKAALVSFAYNIGSGAFARSTLVKRLQAGEDPNTVARAELPRWNRGAGGVLSGLARRRVAELALFTGDPEQPPAITKDAPFSTRLTPNFTYGEFALNQEARRFTQNYQIATAIELAQYLEKVRTQFGNRPVRITSGHRPPAVNRTIGGAHASEHLFDGPGVGAVDIVVDGVNINEVQAWINRTWPYSVGLGAPRFVHVGIRAGRPKVRWAYN